MLVNKKSILAMQGDSRLDCSDDLSVCSVDGHTK